MYKNPVKSKKSQKMVKKSDNPEKSRKLTKFTFCRRKKMITSKFSNIWRTRFDQSSSVHPVSESRGGTLTERDEGRTNERTNERTKEILVSSFGLRNSVVSFVAGGSLLH